MWSNNNPGGGTDPRLLREKDRPYETVHYQNHKIEPLVSNGNRGPDGNKNRFVDGQGYRVVEQVAYAHPVRERPIYYAAQPSFPANVSSTTFAPPIPPQPQHTPSLGYQYYYNSQASTPQYVDPKNRIGHAKVKRAPNSDCMLHDPAETLVIDYADGALRHHRKGHRHVPVPQGSSSPSSSGRSSSMPPPKIVVQHGNQLTHRQSHHHPMPISLSSDLHSSSEVTITSSSSTRGPAHQDVYGDYQYMHRVQHHNHQSHSKPFYDQHRDPARHHDTVDGTSAGKHHEFSMNHGVGFHQANFVPQANFMRPVVPRGSHSSDTSSAYSGSDTMQSLHSSCENVPIDLNGLHESVVDSDEDLTDSMDSLAIRDIVRESLEKDPVDRTDEDIDVLLGFTQSLEAFNKYTIAVRRALCSVMVFAVVDKAGTIVMNDREELDSWSVIINGEVRIDRTDPETGHKTKKILKVGEDFGIEATMEKLYHQGVMRTVQDDCQFVCITQVDYYKILNEGESNRKCYEENGKIVLVTEKDAPSKSNSHKVIRGTPHHLLAQLIDQNSTTDPTYVEDFLLTHRTFLPSIEVIQYLLRLMTNKDLMDRVIRVLIHWVHNHFPDFETDPVMMDYLEKFEIVLEREKKNGHLRMLDFACSEKAKKRVVIITRSNREEELQFSLIGGNEHNHGIYVETVEKLSKASDAGLKRGDQILEVNRQSFEAITIPKAMSILKENTHLEMLVKSNLLAFKEVLQSPDDNSPKPKSRRTSNLAGLFPSDESSSTKSRSADDRNTLKTQLTSSQQTSGKDKFLNKMWKMLNHKSGEHDIAGAHLNHQHNNSSDSWTLAFDGPDHSLKVYKSDQQFKYLLVHQNTSAREVVMLTLQEFGITECSSNYTLCEVKVDGEFVRQKRLPDNQTNLAEKLGLGSRYYIKNVMSSEQLVPESLLNDLIKESQVDILQLQPMETATQLMVEDFTTFRLIEATEYVDKLFELDSKQGTPNLTRFGELVNKEMMWTITEIVSEPTTARRVKLIKQFIKIAQHCYKETQNFNSMFAIVSGLDHVVVRRLKSTWDKVPQKYTKLISDMLTVMDPSMNFRRYRNLINGASPPIIPIYPMVNKDLTFIHLGNETYVDELINFEKLRMLAKEIRSLNNMCSVPLDLFTMLERQGSDFSDAMRKMNPPTHVATMKRGTNAVVKKGLKDSHNAKRMFDDAQMVRRVKAYLAKMPVIENEEELMKMSLRCEASNISSSLSLHSQLAHNPQSHQQRQPKNLQNSVSSSSVASNDTKPVRRMPSPSPSNGSTASSTSLVSEGKKSSHSAAKFDASEAGIDLANYSDQQTLSQSNKLKSSTLPGFMNPNITFEEFENEALQMDTEQSCLSVSCDDQNQILRTLKVSRTEHRHSFTSFSNFHSVQRSSDAAEFVRKKFGVASPLPKHMADFDLEKFIGTDSPKAVRKLMALSEPGKTRRHQPKHSVSSLHTNPSPTASPKNARKTGHERSASETAPPVSLSAESSSVATMTMMRKSETSSKSLKSLDDTLSKSKSLPRPHPKDQQKSRARIARTLSRENAGLGDDGSQISAV